MTREESVAALREIASPGMDVSLGAVLPGEWIRLRQVAREALKQEG